MSRAQRQPAGALPGAHPAVLAQRVRARVAVAALTATAVAAALEITLAVPEPNFVLVFAVLVGVAGLAILVCNSRLEITVAILAVYLGCLDGPIKLFSGGGNTVAVLRDVLILAVCIGAIARVSVRREGIDVPPLTGWVVAFVAIVLMNVLNPNTGSLLKVAGGIRQQLEWIPFFFFGYALIRSKARLQRMFVLLGIIALLNGIVATYQSRLSPQQLASWGPGYAERVLGANGSAGDTYFSEGEGHVRPFGLGSDIGFGGGVGMIALPGCIALLATVRGRRRWLIGLLALGSLLAVASSLSRTGVLSAVVALIAFGGFSITAGRQVLRPLLAISAILVLAAGLTTALSSTLGSSAFSRYASIAPEKVGTTAPDYKEVSLKQIPNDIAHDPFGFGLGTAGAASGFGGHTTVTLEGHGFSSETEFNFIVNETGAPGLLLFVSFTVLLIALAATRLPRIEDPETRICLAAVSAALVGLTFSGFAGAFTAGQAGGPYYWFAAGICAYWFAGGLQRARARARQGGSGIPALTVTA